MLILQKNKINKLYVVCDDISTINEPIYLWRFVNRITQEELIIELVNEQSDNPRFDLFSLDLPNNLDLDEGTYNWFIYENDTSGVTNYENLNLLSSGDLKIETTFEENSIYEPTTGTNKEYNG